MSSIRIKRWGYISAEEIAADDPFAKRFRDEMNRLRYLAWLQSQKGLDR